jgi:AcrR family transcriptional regulator
VLAAARRQFLAGGYASVTMRSIAAEAGVDVALLSYYFGGKQALFGAALELGVNPAEVIKAALRGDRGDLPGRLIRALVATWDDPVYSATLRALVGAAPQEPAIARLLRELIGSELIEPLAEMIGGPDGRQRAAALAVQLGGIVFTRYLVQLGPVVETSVDELVARLAPAMAQVLDGVTTPAP